MGKGAFLPLILKDFRYFTLRINHMDVVKKGLSKLPFIPFALGLVDLQWLVGHNLYFQLLGRKTI